MQSSPPPRAQPPAQRQTLQAALQDGSFSSLPQLRAQPRQQQQVLDSQVSSLQLMRPPASVPVESVQLAAPGAQQPAPQQSHQQPQQQLHMQRIKPAGSAGQHQQLEAFSPAVKRRRFSEDAAGHQPAPVCSAAQPGAGASALVPAAACGGTGGGTMLFSHGGVSQQHMQPQAVLQQPQQQQPQQQQQQQQPAGATTFEATAASGEVLRGELRGDERRSTLDVETAVDHINDGYRWRKCGNLKLFPVFCICVIFAKEHDIL